MWYSTFQEWLRTPRMRVSRLTWPRRSSVNFGSLPDNDGFGAIGLVWDLDVVPLLCPVAAVVFGQLLPRCS